MSPNMEGCRRFKKGMSDSSPFVLLISPGGPRDPAAEDELAAGLPFLDIYLVGRRDFEYFVDRFFAHDRTRQPKGMVEVIL